MASGQTHLRKATFNLSEEILASLNAAVASGAAASKNAFVEAALRHQLDVIRREERRELWLEASRDPQFLTDLDDVEGAFRHADEESAGSIG